MATTEAKPVFRVHWASAPRPLSVLTVHNYYQQAGGEDEVYRTEAALLERYGHNVTRYEERNDRIHSGILTGIASTWNLRSYAKLRFLAGRSRFDVAHFHNTFPRISPAAYYAIRSAGIPVVQTLHNYRLICAGATLFRDGHPCEECLDRQSVRPALQHGCYRTSHMATTAVTTMLTTHRIARTFREMVDIYIALSEFGKQKFIKGGLPEDRIFVAPHCVATDPGLGGGQGRYVLFAGRMAEEKGVRHLAAASHLFAQHPLHVVGDGPLGDGTVDDLRWGPSVELCGRLEHDQVLQKMREAWVLVFPSIWYEGCPMTILEAMACGLPVIAPMLGAMPEFVKHRHNGLIYRPGDAKHLAEQVQWAYEHREEMYQMRLNARRDYESKYTADRHYRVLTGIYEEAIEQTRRRRAERAAGAVV